MGGVLGYIIAHSYKKCLLTIGVDGEETSCLFEPEFQSGGEPA